MAVKKESYRSVSIDIDKRLNYITKDPEPNCSMYATVNQNDVVVRTSTDLKLTELLTGFMNEHVGKGVSIIYTALDDDGLSIQYRCEGDDSIHSTTLKVV
ncbi:hypothetical protein ABN214_15135 [Proteus terrae]|uniref:hypothetical protein n=1 Tax=Proteus terrae TaxID=1574161 RepID=UPI0032DA6442